MSKPASIFFALVLLLTITGCKKDTITLITQQVDSHCNYELHSLFFINDSVGFVSGGSRYAIGVIAKTTDGGKTWTQPDSIVGKAIYASWFFDPAQGFTGGYDSYLAYTSDSAKTFNVRVFDYAPINAMAFVDRNIGVRVGGDGYASGNIATTVDGGNTWSATSYINNIRAVQFVDENTVVASGYGVVYKSVNKGGGFSLTTASGDFFVGMDFPSPQVGYFAGYEGMILKTTDGCNTFSKVRKGNIPLGKRIHFEAIKFWNDYVGYVVGDNGVMYRTTDGGDNWDLVNQFTTSNLRAIHLFSATSGIVAGDDGKIFLFKQ